MNKKFYLSVALLAGSLVTVGISAKEPVKPVVVSPLHTALATSFETRSGVRSGLLFSIGYARYRDLNVTKALQALGISGVSGATEDSTLSLSLGYRHALGSHWSIDGQYIHQEVNTTPLTGIASTGTTAQTAQQISTALPKLAEGISMTGLYHVPLSARTHVNFGAGVFIWQSERETRLGSTIASHKTSGVDPVLQLGLTYNLTPRIALQGDVERLFMPDEAVNRLSLGIVYSFQ